VAAVTAHCPPTVLLCGIAAALGLVVGMTNTLVNNHSVVTHVESLVRGKVAGEKRKNRRFDETFQSDQDRTEKRIEARRGSAASNPPLNGPDIFA
jgi:hypothetical protein